jgi:predicted aminopeptidase
MVVHQPPVLCFAAMRYYQLIFIAAALGLLSACSTIAYYAQSISGQLRLLSGREPIQGLITNPQTKTSLKQRLVQAQKIRDFASKALDLPDNDSYRTYVQLDHPFIVWLLFATPEFSLQPHQWCFPIVGCVPYRGYFSQLAAEALAQELRTQGMDVYVGGVAAYSTLGWFDDPLLSSMLLQGDLGTASIIFHELAHQQVYVQGDTVFNESFSTAVEKAGVRRWLQARGKRTELRAFDAAWRRKQDFFDLVETTRARLSTLYERNMNAMRKRATKRAIIATMREDYRDLKAHWGGYGGYDYWFNKPINNAKLAAVAIYRDFVPDFERLLAACGGDFARFYRDAAKLGELQPAERRARLNAVATCS